MKKRNILFTSLLTVFLVACNKNSTSSSFNSSSILNSEVSSSSSEVNSSSSTNSSSTSSSSSEEKMNVTKINAIVQNTFELKEVEVEEYYLPGAEKNYFYVEDGLIYQKIDKEENYIYSIDNKNYKLFIEDDEWVREEEDGEIEYNLGYYLKQKYTFEFNDEIIKDNDVGWGAFDGRSSYNIFTTDGIKMGLVINEDFNALDGLLIFDENNNIIYQYVFTFEKKDYQLPTPIVNSSGFFGEKEELYLSASKGSFYIKYDVYDEEGNFFYWFKASSDSSLKYSETKELTIDNVSGLNGEILSVLEHDAFIAYYEEPRTIKFTFNQDNSFVIEIASLDEIVDWYESSFGVMRNEYFGKNDELHLNSKTNYVKIGYEVYDEEGNCLYYIEASKDEKLEYGKEIELNITNVGNFNEDLFNEKEKVAVPAYYEEVKTIKFTFNKDNTFVVEILSLDEIVDWYENNFGIIIDGTFGEKEELTLSTLEGNVSITYQIYDEEGNYLYTIEASSDEKLEYGKEIELNVTWAASFSANYFDNGQDIAVTKYYEEGGTIKLTLNQDNTFEIQMASVDEMVEWYRTNMGLIITGFYGEKEELYINNVENGAAIAYHIYDEEGNYLYWINASSDELLKYCVSKELTTTSAGGLNMEILGETASCAIVAYYEEPRTITLTLIQDNTFEIQMASVDEIVEWYNSQNV